MKAIDISMLFQDGHEQSLDALWSNYVSALEGMHRLSTNDAELFKQYYPVVAPMYVSYDQDASSYQGIEAIWAAFSEKALDSHTEA